MTEQTRSPWDGPVWTWGVGILSGVILGIALGLSMDNLGAGIAIGVALGAAFGVTFSQAAKARRKDVDGRPDPPADGP
jgi:hypothetical protein